MEQEDYSKIYEYEFNGKKYAGEKACISLTSWKARINTVSKTLYSLLKMCPGFHIVLVLSKDEFPLKEKELPDNLMLFVENELIELFWIKPNFKSFKKVLFTMDKYRDVPVISADDDCIYTCNYAQELYNVWKKNKTKIVSYNTAVYFNKFTVCCGPCTLYPASYFFSFNLSILTKIIKIKPCDDWFYPILYRTKPISLNKPAPFIFHDSVNPLTNRKYTNKDRKIHFSYYESCLK